jgi:hypothetical protein
MMCTLAIVLAYALVKFVPDHSDAPAIKQYGTNDVDEWRRAIQGPVVRVIDGGAGHE